MLTMTIQVKIIVSEIQANGQTHMFPANLSGDTGFLSKMDNIVDITKYLTNVVVWFGVNLPLKFDHSWKLYCIPQVVHHLSILL